MAAGGESGGEAGGLLGVDPRGEGVFAIGDECGQDAAELLGSLALPKDDLGEAAATVAIEIDRRGGQSGGGGDYLLRFHALSVTGRHRAKQAPSMSSTAVFGSGTVVRPPLPASDSPKWLCQIV